MPRTRSDLRPSLGVVQVRLRAVLVVLAAVVALLGLAAPTASAHSAPDARSGVAAINPEPVPAVGLGAAVSPAVVGASGLVFDDGVVVSLVDPIPTTPAPLSDIAQAIEHGDCQGYTSARTTITNIPPPPTPFPIEKLPALLLPGANVALDLAAKAEGLPITPCEALGCQHTLPGATLALDQLLGGPILTTASTPSGTGQRICRAVEPDELADLMGSGQYRNIPGIGGGKYFFPTRQQADAFAEMMTKRAMGSPYCTTSGCVRAEVLRQVERISPAGEGAAYYIPDSLLPYIDEFLIHGG